MAEPRIKIGFTLTDHFGNEYSASSNVEVFESLGVRDLDVIGKQLNTFLRQIGYIRSRDYMLMEDLTEEEHDALLDYLQDLRDGNVNVSVTTSTHTTCTTSGYIQSVDEDGGEEND